MANWDVNDWEERKDSTGSGHLTDALDYQAKGVPIFPLDMFKAKYFNQKYSTGKKAHALRAKAQEGIVLTSEEVNFFWGLVPYANLGVYAGKKSGITVIRTHNLEGITGTQTLGYELGGEALELLLGLAVQVHVPFGLGTFLCFQYCSKLLPELLGDGWKDLGLEVFNKNNYPMLLPPSMVEDTHRHERGKYTGSFHLDQLKELPLDVIQYFNSLPKGKYFGNKNVFSPPSILNGPKKTKKKDKHPRTSIKQEWNEQEVASNLERREESWELTPSENTNATFHEQVDVIREDYNLFIQLRDDGIIEDGLLLEAQQVLREDVQETIDRHNANKYWIDRNGLKLVQYQGNWYWVCTPGEPFHGREVKPTEEQLAGSEGASTTNKFKPQFIDLGKDEYGKPQVIVLVEKFTAKGQRRTGIGRWRYIKLDEPMSYVEALSEEEDIPKRKPIQRRSIRRST